jgi:hypothetical protein
VFTERRTPICSACGYEQRNGFNNFLDQELERDFEKEAFDIIAGRTMLLPQREHLEALRSYFIRGMQQIFGLDELAGVAPESSVTTEDASPTHPPETANFPAMDATPLPPAVSQTQEAARRSARITQGFISPFRF